MLIRNHVTSRIALYDPVEEDMPIPLKYIDVTRITETDLESQAESRTSDLWYRHDENDTEGILPRDLSSMWRGGTMVHLLRPAPCPGYRWVQGRLTTHQNNAETR